VKRTLILFLWVSLFATACASPGVAAVRSTPPPERSIVAVAAAGVGEITLDVPELI
jgi:hypothetical protein